MHHPTSKCLERSLIAVGLFAMLSGHALAIDGVVLIDQNKALAGSVTPGDAPGFPVWITQSGSYRLSSNLVVPNAQTNGIEVRAANVQLDLNGFTIRGPGLKNDTASFNLSGIGVTTVVYGPGGGIPISNVADVSIHNGYITGMGSGGVLMGRGSEARSLRVHDNFGFGIEADGPYDKILDNTVTGHPEFFDIYASGGALVRGNAAGTIEATCPTMLIGNIANTITTTSASCTRSQNSPAP